MADPYPNTGGLRNFYQRDDKVIKGIIKKGGVPLNISGWTIIFSLKNSDTDDDADAVIRKLADISVTETGVYVINLEGGTAGDTDIPVKMYVWDIRVLDDNDVRQVGSKGTIWCLQPVTHYIP